MLYWHYEFEKVDFQFEKINFQFGQIHFEAGKNKFYNILYGRLLKGDSGIRLDPLKYITGNYEFGQIHL